MRFRFTLAAAALLAASAALAGGVPFAWPNPGMVSRVEVPGEVTALGVPVRLQIIRMKGTPIDALWRIYADAFRKARLFVPGKARQVPGPHGPMLTALDPVHRLSYSVALWPNADGSVSALLSESNLAARKKGPEPLAPVYPGGTELLVSDQEGARLMTYRTRAAEKDVSAFYTDVLGRAGFVRLEDGEFLRGAEALDVQVRADAKGLVVAIVARLSAPSSAPPSPAPEARR